ncbi:hypothetical protein EDL79_01375 [Ehrlichia ruminantium]|uniref:Integral membrane protein n=1 Tax=Ehrlichia ruminantium TaxID=779 RepID=A0AAE6UIC1_EHRRU|nr:hypothetical protein [Ehrlichia ruminantium]QGR02330.1 hypothetical protein EDL81_01375 [Ehrlichia ruminantium]QGR03250.1 hypothetical protein EDL80_01375 [Ehrlichia ruminantium]QGR04175.1 hypothetical protein EDL79_01375 [Ehrlichia ruminantium]
MPIVDEYVRRKLISYKALSLLFPEAKKVRDSILNEHLFIATHKNYSFPINYINYVSRERNFKDQIISGIRVSMHIFVCNTLFFMMVCLCIPKFWRTFTYSNVGSSIAVHMLLFPMLLSCMSVILGCIIHAIVLKSQGKPISNFLATEKMEDQLLCTGVFTFLFTVFVRIDKFLSSFSMDEVDNSVYMERAWVQMSHLKDLSIKLYLNVYSFMVLYYEKHEMNMHVQQYLDKMKDNIKDIVQDLHCKRQMICSLIDTYKTNSQLYIGKELCRKLDDFRSSMLHSAFLLYCDGLYIMYHQPGSYLVARVLESIRNIADAEGYEEVARLHDKDGLCSSVKVKSVAVEERSPIDSV